MAIDQAALPQINRNDPEYTRKISEMAASIMAGNAPAGSVPASVAPSAPRTASGYTQNTWDEGPTIDPLPGDAAAASTPAPTGGRKMVKFTDDIGDEQEVEIDFDEAKLTELAKRARRSENLEQEMAAMRDEMSGKMSAAQQDMEKARRYLELEKAGSKEAVLDELFKDVGGYEGFRKQLIDEHEGYVKMTAEEQRDHDVKRMQADSARKLSELEKRLAEKGRDADARVASADRAGKVAVLNSVYSKFKFDNEAGDPAITKINEMIFNEAQANIRQLESQRVTVTENILNREFRKAHQLFKGKISVGAKAPKVDPGKAIADQADAAMAAAQTLAAQTMSVGGPENESEVIGRWLGLIKEGKGFQVSQEAAKSAKSQGLYTRLANMISRDRSILTRK